MSIRVASDGAFPRVGAALVLLLAALVLAGAAALRGTEYDENYSVFVTGGTARPEWPRAPFAPADAEEPFAIHADAATTARLLRDTDVHPPLYFWILGAWRRVAGDSLEAMRALSILFSLAAVAAWMAVAWRAGLPPLLVGAITALSYGFAYTGHIARGFALAHLLVALAALAAIEARRRGVERGGAPLAAAAGVAVGLASFSNYLAIFPGAAVLGWLVLWAPSWRDRLRFALAAGLPLAAIVGADLYFFLAQKSSRPGQFEAFALAPALGRLAQMNAASLLGGLPLYVEGRARAVLGGLLALVLAAAALAVAVAWRRLGPTRWLWLLGAAAPSAGLLALGAAFDNQPAELRYVAFAAPFLAALVAGAAAVCWRWAPRAAALGIAALLAVQAAGAAGMAAHPATQQPFRAAAAAAAPLLGADAVLLVPFGNDGVGVVGSLLREAPARQPVLVLRDADAGRAPARSAGFARAVLVAIGDRGAAAQAAEARAAFRADPGWRGLGVLLRDHRGGFVEAFEAVPAAALPGGG